MGLLAGEESVVGHHDRIAWRNPESFGDHGRRPLLPAAMLPLRWMVRCLGVRCERRRGVAAAAVAVGAESARDTHG